MSAWQMARKRRIKRIYFLSGKSVVLELGVNYFVEKLEKLGCKTLASCEGHPRGFYVLFSGTYEVAKRIAMCGYFTVDLSPRHGPRESFGGDKFAISLNDEFTPGRKTPFSLADRNDWLSHAAQAWEEGLHE